MCYNFSGGVGCKYGDSCRFKHDKIAAKKEKRCMLCGMEGHFRTECPTASSESRGSGEVVGASSAKASAVAKALVPKAKSCPQVKGVEEAVPSSGAGDAQSRGGSKAQGALLEEAAKLLKGVVLKPLHVEEPEGSDQVKSPGELGISQGWLLSVVASASDPMYALVDSGATNALRPAEEGEISRARVISVQLASGATRLHVNPQGTFRRLHPSLTAQKGKDCSAMPVKTLPATQRELSPFFSWVARICEVHCLYSKVPCYAYRPPWCGWEGKKMLPACDAERDQAMAHLCGQGYAAPAQSSELSRLRK